jgi:hypothetical protein
MQWTIDQLQKRAKAYNRIYFNNEIKKPIYVRWSRRMYNTHSRTNAYHKEFDDYHLIMFNVSYSNVSEEMMRSTLIHEMIHAWQSEYDPNLYDEWSKYKGHGPSFTNKCEELNAKFKFTYPLARYFSTNALANLKKQNKDVYFVYIMTTSNLAPDVQYPIGVFIKFLYSDEVKSLINKGLSVKYCKNAKFTDKTEYYSLDNKYVTQTDVPISYSKFKNITVKDFVNDLHDKFGRYHIVTDDDFNYDDCIEVV